MLQEERNLAIRLSQGVIFDLRPTLLSTLKARVLPTFYALDRERMVVKQGWRFLGFGEALTRVIG